MKKIRRMLIAGLLAVVMMVPMAVPVAASSDELIRYLLRRLDYLEERLANMPETTPPPVQHPTVALINPTSIDVMPGEVLDVAITVRNIGSGNASNVLTQASTGTGPFVVEFLNNTNIVSTINQGAQRQMNMRLTVDENAAPGIHTITLNHDFRNVAGAPFNRTDTISVRIGGEAGATNVRLSNFSASVSTVGPNQSFTVTADLQNLGSVPVNNVQVTVGNLSGDTISMTSDLSQAFVSTLESGQTRQVSFTFQTARNIPSAIYQLNFRVHEGADELTTAPFWINVLSDYTQESANIEMRGLTAPTGRLSVGQTGTISFELVNTGDAAAQNITVTATSADGALRPATSNRQNVRNLDVGETRAFQFGFFPAASAQTQSYTIQLRVEYTMRGTDVSSSFVQYIALNVYNPDAQAETTPPPRVTPRMIVDAYTPTPQIPRAGQNFDLELTFLNTSPTRDLSNIRVTLNPARAVGGGADLGAVFTPVGGSNTLFIPSVSAGEYVVKTITMFTIPDAPPRVYTMEVEFDFYDENNVNYTMSEQLSIPVAQLARLEMHLPQPFIPEMMDMFSTIEFEFSVINTGRVNLRNTWVRVEGPFDTSESDIFMATLGAQRTHFYTGRIRPLEAGLLEGALIIYGEDDVGSITELRHEFTVYVMEMGGGFGFEGGGDRFPPGFGDGGMFEGGGDRFPPGFGMWEEDGDGDGIFARIFAFVRRPVFWGPAAGVIVAAVVAVVVIIMRKKSRLSFDDDSDAFN